MYGDARKYLVAGVWIDAAAVAKKLEGVAADERLAARDALVQSRIDRVNAQLARFETIKKFAVIDEPLTVEDGLLTPTLKIRRKAIYERFGARLAALYEDTV